MTQGESGPPESADLPGNSARRAYYFAPSHDFTNRLHKPTQMFAHECRYPGKSTCVTVG